MRAHMLKERTGGRRKKAVVIPVGTRRTYEANVVNRRSLRTSATPPETSATIEKEKASVPLPGARAEARRPSIRNNKGVIIVIIFTGDHANRIQHLFLNSRGRRSRPRS